MENLEVEKAKLVSEITEMKKGEIEEMFLISFYSLSSYIKSLIAFGHRSNVTKDNLKVIKEMFNIIKTERNMLNFILKNIDNFHIDSIMNVIDMLDDANDKTIMYYYDVINEIEDACEMNVERRGIRPRKNFETINHTNVYAQEIIAMAESKESIKNFLGFEDVFLEFIKDKDVANLKVSEEVAMNIAYVTPLYNSEGKIVDFKMLIPEVVNLETALMAISLYRKSYDLYRVIKFSSNKDMSLDYSWTKEKYKDHLYKKSIDVLQIKM